MDITMEDINAFLSALDLGSFLFGLFVGWLLF